MKKETPILFSTPMVQAIIENRKTQTRRTRGLQKFNENPNCWTFTYRGKNLWSAKHNLSSVFELEFKCPYGKVGDLLWVRETIGRLYTIGADDKECFVYKTDSNSEQLKPLFGKWTPSIHMPKHACRLWLEIASIKIERLQDISTSDIKAEGVRVPVNNGNVWYVLGESNNAISFLTKQEPNTEGQIFFAHWAELWCKVNCRKSWDNNPFVWVIEFKKVQQP